MAKGHIIPEFYLRLFLDSDIPETKSKELWYYDIVNMYWNKKGPANLGYQEDYYILSDENKAKYDFIEQNLQKVESKVAPILRDKIANKIKLTNEDKGYFALFAALMRIRVPSFIDSISSFFSEIRKTEMSFYHQNKDAFESLKKEIEEKSGKLFPLNFTHETMNPEFWEINSDMEVKSMMFNSIENFVEILLHMNWTFMYSSGKDYFITSDNPYYLSNALEAEGQITLGHKDPRNIVTMPLSKSVCFYASWENIDKIIDINKLGVRSLNYHRISTVEKYIYSTAREFVGDHFIKKYEEAIKTNGQIEK